MLVHVEIYTYVKIHVQPTLQSVQLRVYVRLCARELYVVFSVRSPRSSRLRSLSNVYDLPLFRRLKARKMSALHTGNRRLKPGKRTTRECRPSSSSL